MFERTTRPKAARSAAPRAQARQQDAHPILQLQGVIGNQQTQRLLQRVGEADKVVAQAREQEGTLRHIPDISQQIRKDGFGILNVLNSPGEVNTMNCVDSVVYTVIQAGVLEPAFATAMYEAVYNAITEAEQPEGEVGKNNAAMSALLSEETDLKEKITALQQKLKALESKWKPSNWVMSKEEKAGKKTEIETELTDLQRDLETCIKAQAPLRKEGIALGKLIPTSVLREFVRADEAVTFAKTVAKRNADPSSEIAENDIEYLADLPPKGWTILMTRPGSETPDMDHSLLSLGDGKAAHLNTAIGTQIGQMEFAPGNFHEIDLKGYIKAMYKDARVEWHWKKAPPLWEGPKAQAFLKEK